MDRQTPRLSTTMENTATQTLPEISPRFRTAQKGEKNDWMVPGQKVLATKKYPDFKVMERAKIHGYRIPSEFFPGTFMTHTGEEVIQSKNHIAISGSVAIPNIGVRDEVVVRMMNRQTKTEMWPSGTIVQSPEYPMREDAVFKVKLTKQSITREFKRSDIWLRTKFRTVDRRTQTDSESGETCLLIQLRYLLPPAKVGEEVLFRCPDDGWHYHGKIILDCEDFSYIVSDGNGHRIPIWREDIVCENDRKAENLEKDDRVLVMHPNYINSFCPAVMTSAKVAKLFDGNEVKLEENTYVAKIAKIKSQRDEEIIKYLAKRWVEDKSPILALHEDSGQYHMGKVLKITNNTYTEYEIEWNTDSQKTSRVQAVHMFGSLTPTRTFHKNEHVLAPYGDSSKFKGICYLPGEIKSVNGKEINVLFSNNSEISIEKKRCFWISPSYHYDAVIRYINCNRY